GRESGCDFVRANAGEVYAFNGGGKSATVINAKTNKVVATVPLAGKPEFAAADALGARVFCNIEDKSEVAVIDIKTHAVTASWPLAGGQEPTGMAFDAVHHRLFVGCGNKLMAMLDTDTARSWPRCQSGQVWMRARSTTQ